MAEDNNSQLVKVKYRVIDILTQYPATRNSDKLLCEEYYRIYENIIVQLTKVKTPTSSITRARRGAQRRIPSLRPTDSRVKLERERKMEEFRDFYSFEEERLYDEF